MAEPLPKRLRSYTVEEKILHLRNLEDSLTEGRVASMSDYASHYRIPYHTIRKWRLPDLEAAAEEKKRKVRKIRQEHRGLWPEVEERLQTWFREQRDSGLPVAVLDLQEKAELLFQEWWNSLPQERRDDLLRCRPIMAEFQASGPWVEGFMERKRVSFRRKNKNTTTIPADAAIRVRVFKDELTGVIRQFDIELAHVLNMDQTFILFDFPPNYTCNPKGMKAVDVKTSRSNAKLGCTVTLAIAATGGKLKAHITFPRRGFVGQLHNLEEADIPQNVTVTSSQTGWIREDTIEHWREMAFTSYLQEHDIENFILIVDMYRVHRTENFGKSITEMGGILQFVPSGCTSLAQP